MLAPKRGNVMNQITRKGKTNWDKIKGLSEDAIAKAANTDLDSPLLTSEELSQFKRVKPVEVLEVKAIRDKLHMSQEQFAYYFGVSVRTIQEWEQHRRKPTGTARNFLKVIAHYPKIVRLALTDDRKAG